MKRERLVKYVRNKFKISKDIIFYEKRQRSFKYVRNKTKFSQNLKFDEKERDQSKMCGINLRLVKI